MRKWFIALASLVVFTSQTVYAVFTPAEKLQAAKIVEAHSLSWRAIDSLAHSMTDNLTPATRDNYVEVLSKLLDGAAKCGEAQHYLQGVTDDREEWFTDAPGNGRTHDLAKVASRVPQCVQKLTDATTLIMAYGFDQLSTVAGILDGAVFLLGRFDKDENGTPLELAYADPLNPDYPQVIAQHGDHDVADNSLAGAIQYLLNGAYAAKNFLGSVEVYTSDASDDFENVWRRVGEAGAIFARLQGLAIHVAIQEDIDAMDAQFAASQGQRPALFFFLVRQLQQSNGDGATPDFTGEIPQRGYQIIMGFLGLSAAYTLQPLIQVNSLEEVQHWTLGGKGGRNSNQDGRGRYLAMLGDFQDSAWRFARWVDQAAGFKISPPPPSGPPATLVCGTGTMQDNTTEPPSCVSTLVCPPVNPDEVLRATLDFDEVSGTVQFSCMP